MIASAYFSPPTRLPIDAAESAHREGAAGFPPFARGCSAASSIAPAPGAPTPAVERHGADGAPAQSPSAPSIEARNAPMWHGGPAIPGDVLLPPSTTGKARVCHGGQWVYVTPNRHLALTYASTCNGWLYEVEPLGGVEHDPDSMLPSGVSMRCRTARIRRRFKPSNAEMATIAALVRRIDAMLEKPAP